jgi:hypothetical protein
MTEEEAMEAVVALVAAMGLHTQAMYTAYLPILERYAEAGLLTDEDRVRLKSVQDASETVKVKSTDLAVKALGR